MKIRTSNGINIGKLQPGAVLVVENFGHVVLKKAKFSSKLLDELEQVVVDGLEVSSRLQRRLDKVKLVVCLPNLLPGHGGLIDKKYPILRTDVRAGSVIEVVSEKALAKRKLVVAESVLAEKGCNGEGGCGGNCGCHGAESAKTARDVLEAYAESSASGLPAFKAPIGFNLRWFIRDPGSDNCELVIRLRRNQCRFPELIGKVVDGKVVLTLSDAPLAQKDGSAASILKDMIQEHVKKPGIVPYRFEGKPWVKV